MNSRVRSTPKIQGKPGQTVGAFVVPSRGKITLELQGKLLQSKLQLAYGLETKHTYLPIHRIDAVEIISGRRWWLLWIGIFTAFWIIGILLIIAFFLIKQQSVVIYSGRTTQILFFPEEDFKRVQAFVEALNQQINPTPKKRTDVKPSLKK